MDAGGDFPRSPAALLDREGALGRDAAPGILLAGKNVRGRDLPCLMLDAIGGGTVHYFLIGDDVLAKNAKRTPIPTPLRSYSPVVAIRYRGRGIGEDPLLPS